MNAHTIATPTLASLYPERQLQALLSPEKLVVTLNGLVVLDIALQPATQDGSLQGTLDHTDKVMEQEAILAACEGAFTQNPALEKLTLRYQPSTAIDALLADGLLHRNGENSVACTAQALWQTPQPWLPKASFGATPQQYVMTDAKRHPLRPVPQSRVLYRRFIPWIGQALTFELTDPERDLEAFNRWMNSPRVARFWEEEGSLDQHRAYLQKLLDDPHAQPVTGFFDNQPFGYFEIYWAKEDRIAPFYEANDYDRGLHLLVGEESFRGKAFYTAWFSSICHYLFLDDPRTQRIVCEPRHDNQRQIANFDRSGFAKLKHFDFPHKRALLVMLSRERFFGDGLYQPLKSQ
ncbi:GNAT family N-acetyltransferase [Stutzerimonas kirkiae]|uniref:GNAT family N-acetyltransferase n=1 Tax=Stutzerimonas kirkiae TaxID=2211392 RepID=UPI00103841DA|nr:GNAT family N-acetyltransferase [Stutzerimonas kirkiae]TBV09718.1 N-acetyltransferase [Stutzerimonas kirkiae]